MSQSSNNKGRAYEYAWINVLYTTLHKLRNTEIVSNSSLIANKKAWNAIDADMQHLFVVSANAAVDMLLELEPLMSENVSDTLFLEFQQDSAGVKGDVRDIVIKRKDICWDIGLSIKHNHEAIKHSRLSHHLDFGKEWFDIPCSQIYWDTITPVFNRLKIEKEKGTEWSGLQNKETVVYEPLLKAFMEEIKRAYKMSNSVPIKMIEYLLGVNDYYKVISIDNKRLTVIHSFNVHNTLNKKSNEKTSAIKVPVVELPDELVAIRFKRNSNNTIEVYFNKGWQLNFRIHNASKKVEPSLKFDIQFVGMPTSILNIECKWK